MVDERGSVRRRDDVSSEHFDWLVAGRSLNQQATLALYKIISSNERILDRDLAQREIAHQLAAIAFSLWRAVFLSDLTGQVADRSADLKKFLQSLIAHNAVLYQTDFASREWTFEYYLDNALHRIAGLDESILREVDKGLVAGSAKERWANAQRALDAAISNFARSIGEHDTA